MRVLALVHRTLQACCAHAIDLVHVLALRWITAAISDGKTTYQSVLLSQCQNDLAVALVFSGFLGAELEVRVTAGRTADFALLLAEVLRCETSRKTINTGHILLREKKSKTNLIQKIEQN